jgi:glycosyltransferase involved in cell wall biosynthesis
MKSAISKRSIFYFAASENVLIKLQMLRSGVKERVAFDCPLIKPLIGFSGIILARLLLKLQRVKQAFTVLSSIHSAACSSWATHVVQKDIKASLISRNRQSRSGGFANLFRAHAEHLRPATHTQKFFEEPIRMLGPMVVVLKKSRPNEKGVISILYSYALPLFAKLFDIERIAKDYFFVLEPSWSGYCNLDILCYSQLDCPVFVQAYEPRDEEFIRSLCTNLIPVPVSNNWWVDHRIFRPLPDVSKDVDVIMVAGWAHFKRHHQFFHSLMKLRRKGIVLKTVLVGYPMGQSRDDVFEAAAYYGVQEQLELYEFIPAEEVNYHLNRAKVNVVWSRKEGVNRAIIEGMFAGVPCILREGFNYGYHYPYINGSTGCYSSEVDLPNKLLWMARNHQRFSPREWVLRHMSCEKANAILSESIKRLSLQMGEKWTEEPVVKVNGLHGMQYWNSQDQNKFDEDYNFLTSCRRNRD